MTADRPWLATPLRGVMARWDAVVIRWALDGDECSDLLGTGTAGPVGDVTTYGIVIAEHRMRLLVTLEQIILSVFDGDEDRVRAWLRRSNPNLSRRTPIEVMTSSPEWIEWLIRALGVAA